MGVDNFVLLPFPLLLLPDHILEMGWMWMKKGLRGIGKVRVFLWVWVLMGKVVVMVEEEDKDKDKDKEANGEIKNG